MNIKKYIEIGEKKAGKQKILAEILNIADVNIRMAKSGKRGLPDAVCIQLADYIEVDRLEVIAASNLVTEKDEKKRKIFESCIKKTSKAASIIVAAGVISIMTPQANALNNNTLKNNNLQEYTLLALSNGFR